MTYLIYTPNPELEGIVIRDNPVALYADAVTYSKIVSSVPGAKRGEKTSITTDITVSTGLNELDSEQIAFLQEHDRAKNRFALGIYKVVEADNLAEEQSPTGTLKDYSNPLCQLLITNCRHRDITWLEDNARSDPRPEIRKSCDQKIQTLKKTMTGVT